MRHSIQPRSVLLVAFHFPPIQGSSGVQRTLRFAQHLPTYGWQPTVLTIVPQAYEVAGEAVGNEVPPSLVVCRARGYDAARQLSLFGRYPRSLALPDRWATWRFWAVRKAAAIARNQKLDAVWSTFPIATAHLIGSEVTRRTNLPWIAEFRDPMWQGDYPPDSRVNAMWKKIETHVCTHASRIVVTTPGAHDQYADRFPHLAKGRLALIQNGYDEDTFLRADAELLQSERVDKDAGDKPIVLLHSGLIYRSERDPSHLFAAIARMKADGQISEREFQLVLRASGDDRAYRRDLEQLGIQDIVRLEPPVEYLRALKEMLVADGLLLLQAGNCNAQIPAKLYEYLRTGRPIVALTDPRGDTARTLNSAGAGIIARLDSFDEIEKSLMQFIAEVRSGSWRRASRETVASFSREAQAGQLAQLLDAVVAE